MRTLRGKPCSAGWTVARVALYVLVGGAAVAHVWLLAAGTARRASFERAPFFASAWGWEPDGRLAIAEYDRTDAFFVARMYWKLAVIDPDVVAELTAGFERRDGWPIPNLARPLAWWPSDAPERSFRHWSHCAEQFKPCRDLYYDPATREAYLAWEWG